MTITLLKPVELHNTENHLIKFEEGAVFIVESKGKYSILVNGENKIKLDNYIIGFCQSIFQLNK